MRHRRPRERRNCGDRADIQFLTLLEGEQNALAVLVAERDEHTRHASPLARDCAHVVFVHRQYTCHANMSTYLNISSNVVKPPLTPIGGKSPHEAHSIVRGKQTLPLSSVHHSGAARPGNPSRIGGRSRDNLSPEQRVVRQKWVSALLCIYGPVGPSNHC